jgi:hypothetical protein
MEIHIERGIASQPVVGRDSSLLEVFLGLDIRYTLESDERYAYVAVDHENPSWRHGYAVWNWPRSCASTRRRCQIWTSQAYCSKDRAPVERNALRSVSIPWDIGLRGC